MGDLKAKTLPEDGKIKQNGESKERMLFKRMETLKCSTTGLFVANFRVSKQFTNRNSRQEMFVPGNTSSYFCLETVRINTISLQEFFKDFAFLLATSVPKSASQ